MKSGTRLDLLPYLLIFPITAWIVVTIFIPLFNVVKESFYNTGFVGTSGSFIGFDNYKQMLFDTPYWRVWSKSLWWVIGNGLLQTVLAYSVALLLNRPGKIRQWLRTWMIIPWVIPTVVVCIFWKWIFNGSYGILSQTLLSLGWIHKPLNLLGDNFWSLPTVIFVNTWHWFPFMAVIILAGLSIIPHDLYEASSIDGASKWQQFWYVTFPSLGSIMFALGLVGTLWTFNIFDVIYILTEGGPAEATTTVPIFIYKQAFESFQLGKASATSVMTSLLLLLFAFLFIKFASPKEE